MYATSRTVFFLGLSTLILAAGSTEADPGPARRGGFEIFAGLPEGGPIDRESENIVGLRLSVPIAPQWKVEASWSHRDDSGFFQVDGDFADLSFRFDILANDRLQFFTFGGPGWYSNEVTRIYGFPFDESIIQQTTSQDGFAFHFGVGLDIRLGERFYLRPDLRHRLLEDIDGFDDRFTEGTVALGFRF